MKKIVVIHQPDFMPYLGFFHRLLNAELYMILDDVQFLRRGWHHRDKIKTQHGDTWLTVGIRKAPQNTKINEIYLNNENWKEQHLRLIKQCYQKAPFFNEIFPFVERLYNHNYEKMMDINLASIKLLIELFDINVKIDFSSKYSVETKSNQLLVDLLTKVDATCYLSGIGAKDYFDPVPFEEAGIKVIWQEFKHPCYSQLYGDFIPYLSSIDLLFNCGIEKSREILRSI